MKKVKIILISLVIIGVGLNLGIYIDVLISKSKAKELYKKVQNNMRYYVYDDFSNALNSVLYITDLKDSNALISYYYYQSIKRDSPAHMSEMLFLPISVSKPIYLLKEIAPNSNIMEVVDFDTICWGYIKGYAYRGTLHKNPPPDSLVRKLEKYISTKNASSDKNEVVNHTNPYGWYCKECQ